MKLLYSYMRRLCAYITDRLYQFKRFSPLSKEGLGLSCPVFTKVTGILPVALVFFQFVCLAQESPAGREATEVGEMKPLEIGDTIPEALWNLPLQVVNHPEGKETITLSDYRDKKLIILDFWTTWCTSCIKKFDSLVQLEEQNKQKLKILPVSYQTSSEIISFINLQDDFPLVSISDDKILKMLFPHTFVPYYVWLDPEGVLIATTESDAVNKDIVYGFLETGILKTPKKFFVDYGQPVFVKDQYNDLTAYGSFFSSKEIPGFGWTNKRRYKNDQFYSWIIVNSTLRNLVINTAREVYKQKKEVFGIKKIIWEIDETKFDQNKYTYEVIVPLHSTKNLPALILNDLNRFSDFKLSIEERWADCLVLKAIDKSRLPVSNIEEPTEKQLIHTGKGKLNNYPLSTLVKSMNNFLNTDLYVIDESGIQQNVNIELDLSKNISEVNDQLIQYGLSLTKKKRNIKQFIVQEAEKNTSL